MKNIFSKRAVQVSIVVGLWGLLCILIILKFLSLEVVQPAYDSRLGSVQYVEGSILRKSGRANLWEPLYINGQIYEGDKIVAADFGLTTLKFAESARLHFGRGARFEVRGIYVENRPTAILIKLISGKVQAVVGRCEQCLSIVIRSSRSSYEVKPGQGFEFTVAKNRSMVKVPIMPVALDSPALYAANLSQTPDQKKIRGSIEVSAGLKVGLGRKLIEEGLLYLLRFDDYQKYRTLTNVGALRYFPYDDIFPDEGHFYFKNNRLIAFQKKSSQPQLNAEFLHYDFSINGRFDDFQVISFKTFKDFTRTIQTLHANYPKMAILNNGNIKKVAEIIDDEKSQNVLYGRNKETILILKPVS